MESIFLDLAVERFNLKRSENYKITLRGKGTLAVFSRMFSIGENVEMWSILVAISQDKAAAGSQYAGDWRLERVRSTMVEICRYVIQHDTCHTQTSVGL